MRGKDKLELNLLPVSEFGLKRVASELDHCDVFLLLLELCGSRRRENLFTAD